MIKVGVSGALGKMGREVIKTVFSANDMELVCAVDIIKNGEDIGELVLNQTINVKIDNNLEDAIKSSKPDVMIDFTSPSIIFENAKK